jgi:hypothetical protein
MPIDPSKESPEVQAEIAAFEAQHSSLLGQRAILDRELQQLLSSRNQTDEQRARIAQIQNETSSIAIQINQLAIQESAIAQSIPVDDINNAQVKKLLLQEILITTPLPPVGKVSIITTTIDPSNLIQYMTLTQHLNPYGRKRQCDTDLENLMSIINKDVNGSIAIHKETIKNSTKIVK